LTTDLVATKVVDTRVVCGVCSSKEALDHTLPGSVVGACRAVTEQAFDGVGLVVELAPQGRCLGVD
jgi:hypothetical protein